jgi:tyrosine-protein kinase Etk/Wzc
MPRLVEAKKHDSMVATPSEARISASSSRSGPRVRQRQEEEQPTVRDQVATIIGSWVLVCGVVLAALVAGAGYYFTKAPVYQADALVQVEEKQKGLAGLEDLSDMMKTQTPAETEIEILHSRFLLGTVIDELGLEVTAAPRYLPILGGAVARRRDSEGPSSPLFGLTRYAWGGERIVVQRFDVPPAMLGQAFTLVAQAGGAYELYGPEREPVATGVVGAPSKPLPGSIQASILITELAARPGTEFVVTREARLTVMETLQQHLNVAEKGKKTGVIRLSLEGEDPAALARILDATERSYVRLNIERKSAEAQQTLEFIDNQLPELKQKLETAEIALEGYRSKTGSVDVSLETKANLDQAADVEKELTLLQLQLDESKAMFTDDHPMVATLRGKVRRLQGLRGGLELQFKKLPRSELDSARLLRDVKVANELYVLLLNRSQELKILKSGTIGTVRILDAASVPLKPLSPGLPIVLGAALVGGLLAGIGATFARKAFNIGVEDPELLEAELALSVYASVPHSAIEKRRAKSRRGSRTSSILAATHPNELAIEAIRSMRTGLQFVLADARNNVVSIGGPSPGIGKSFVSVNLAQVLADSSRRVLLVDADLRRGLLHEQLGGERENGLGELLASENDPAQAVREISPNLHFLSTGAVGTKPAELLGSQRYEDVIEWASRTYDVVVIDTAPVLAVTDGVLAARVAGTNFLVLRSGQHPMREIAAAMKRLDQMGVTVHGAIMNDVKPRAGSASKYGYSYQYAYK